MRPERVSHKHEAAWPDSAFVSTAGLTVLLWQNHLFKAVSVTDVVLCTMCVSLVSCTDQGTRLHADRAAWPPSGRPSRAQLSAVEMEMEPKVKAAVLESAKWNMPAENPPLQQQQQKYHVETARGLSWRGFCSHFKNACHTSDINKRPPISCQWWKMASCPLVSSVFGLSMRTVAQSAAADSH